MAKKRHEKEAEKQNEVIEAFNKANPIGTIVDVTKDDSSVDRTKTRSEAWLMGTHPAMIMLDVFSGGYMLQRVTVVEAGEMKG